MIWTEKWHVEYCQFFEICYKSGVVGTHKLLGVQLEVFEKIFIDFDGS